MLLSIAKLASKHGIAPLKKYGQNFIFDESLCDKIVKFSQIDKFSNVLEIGPGPAGLTRSILKSAPKGLWVIETDTRCLPLLEEIKLSYPTLQIKHADALKVSLSEVNNNKIDIVANLPYNIGSQLLTNWLSQIEHINSMTLMLQKEVVDRIVSSHNSKAYGRLSIFCQIFCEVEKCFDVSPKSFYPEPKIWSSIVRLVPKHEVPEPMIRDRLEKITQAAFSGRRKMIKSSLGKTIPNITEILQKLGLDQSLRAENLSPQDYIRIAKAI
ncbi:MAG: 16S rRNA (adenine(1518)-N(6)/adenine(1519)-N(6))-dimethyltransferase RsmA [Rickettsiaceae bacterium]|nr:16S rRNA (adenine(1518)-N(6)/adenine(1519)-N(6))-dimethyltransferase RsmA [Rickettsiaceae bacterium]